MVECYKNDIETLLEYSFVNLWENKLMVEKMFKTMLTLLYTFTIIYFDHIGTFQNLC